MAKFAIYHHITNKPPLFI